MNGVLVSDLWWVVGIIAIVVSSPIVVYLWSRAWSLGWFKSREEYVRRLRTGE